jgi:RNA polymerase sigma-70 factor (ECF subfamily)
MPTTDRIADADLAARARAGSVDAFGGLVGIHHGAVFGFLLALTRHRQDAEDLTQETFLRAWKKFHHYDPAQPLLPWLLALGRRLSIAALRRRRPAPAGCEPPDAPVPDRSLWLWETARATLPPDSYTALWLHYREELPLKDVATILGKREGAVTVVLPRARKSLAASLRSGGAEFSGGLPEPPRLPS